MSNPATYSWQQAYLAAVLETDNDLKAERIAEGKHVIHEGQLSKETC
jgi:hypothetical protein